MLSPRLRLMVGGGSLDPRRGRLRANVSGSASILGRRLRVLSLMHLPWPHGASGRPSWAIALTCGSVLNIHVPMTHTTSHPPPSLPPLLPPPLSHTLPPSTALQPPLALPAPTTDRSRGKAAPRIPCSRNRNNNHSNNIVKLADAVPRENGIYLVQIIQ